MEPVSTRLVIFLVALASRGRPQSAYLFLFILFGSRSFVCIKQSTVIAREKSCNPRAYVRACVRARVCAKDQKIHLRK